VDPEGKISMLDVKPNLPLGLFDGFPYEGQETTISRNTMLYLFTDGVTEAENNNKELLGDDKLVAFLKMNASADPGVLIDLTFEEIKTHANGAEQSDDITVMCIKYC
jgi:sigma-B regulation protein RsbU (phosphoserine phosphatase)